LHGSTSPAGRGRQNGSHLRPGNHHPPAHRTSTTIGFSVHLHSPTRAQSAGAPTAAASRSPGLPGRVARCSRRAVTAASAAAPGVPGAASPPVAAASASAPGVPGAPAGGAEMHGAAKPARPSPRPGSPAGGAGHDRGRTVFLIPSQGGRHFIYRPPWVPRNRPIRFLWSGSIRGDAVEALGRRLPKYAKLHLVVPPPPDRVPAVPPLSRAVPCSPAYTVSRAREANRRIPRARWRRRRR